MKLTTEQINKEFNKLSVVEKRLVVIQDALDSVINGTYLPKEGTYCDSLSPEKDVQTNPNVQCHVCALGSMLVSTTKFVNELTYVDVHTILMNDTPYPKFTSIFSDEQIYLVERCFEITQFYGNLYSKLDRTNSYEARRLNQLAYAFQNEFPDVVDRIVAIFHNMLRNDGILIPEQDFELQMV